MIPGDIMLLYLRTIFRCQGRVFDAEKQIAKCGSFHKKCFTCFKCKHQMDASTFINGPDDEVYCIHCYKVSTPWHKN